MDELSRRGFLRAGVAAGAAAMVGRSLGCAAIGRGEAAGAAPHAWRPYCGTSVFNTPIPADAPAHPESDAMIRTLMQSRGTPGKIHVNIQQWSIPVWPVPAEGAVMTEVVCDRQSYSGEASVRCPVWPVVKPDPMSDAHMVIVDRAAGMEWDFWGARWQDGALRTKAASTVKLDGDGLTPLGGCRLVGFALLSGLIRPEEIEAGEIDHALVFAHDYVGPAVWPASRGGGRGGRRRGGADVTPVPAGGCVQLDPSLDVDALDIPPAGKMIARALQKYGMYNSDFAGGLVVYAENPLARATDPWPALGFGNWVARGIPVDRMRVVAPEAIKAAATAEATGKA